MNQTEQLYIERFDNIIIDTVNLAYKTFHTKEETPSLVSKKQVYKESICSFINSVEDLIKKYLHSDGNVYLLFDNYHSRLDMQSMLTFSSRKELDESYKNNRKKESKEFYNSINLIRYYYLIGPSKFHTLQISNLEADDLVKPLLSILNKNNINQTSLLVTSDLDWGRYLTNNVKWIPKLDESVETVQSLSSRCGFPIDEPSIIMYKALFGDASDNIKSTINKTSSNESQFIEFLKENKDINSIPILCKCNDWTSKYPFLIELEPNERQYRINVQLVSTVPCGESYISKLLTTGRNSNSVYQSVRSILGLNNTLQKFTFGNLKRPRGC